MGGAGTTAQGWRECFWTDATTLYFEGAFKAVLLSKLIGLCTKRGSFTVCSLFLSQSKIF